jgi:hypothetical protein
MVLVLPTGEVPLARLAEQMSPVFSLAGENTTTLAIGRLGVNHRWSQTHLYTSEMMAFARAPPLLGRRYNATGQPSPPCNI